MAALPWLIVDGYNVIGSRLPMHELEAEDLDAARERLVARVAAFAHGRYRAVVVFDAAGNPRSDGTPRHVVGVAVIFTRAGHQADEVIEGLARRARERGEAVTVATSDADTQWTVLGEGALRMSARELEQAMDERAGSGAGEARLGSARAAIGERVDAETRRRLAMWARGRA